MTRGDLLNLVTNSAKRYVDGAKKSIIRNKHMNMYNGEPLSQYTIDAIIVDFINHLGIEQCMDWALYTEDLRKGRRNKEKP